MWIGILDSSAMLSVVSPIRCHWSLHDRSTCGDSAACHTAPDTINLLHEQFPRHVISKHGNLKPWGCFLWGSLRSLDYTNNPQTIQTPEGGICSCYQWYSARSVWKSDRKLCEESGLVSNGHWLDTIFHYQAEIMYCNNSCFFFINLASKYMVL